MADLIPAEAVREHQLAEHNYELVLQQRRAMKIAQFANHEIPLIVSKFIEKMMNVNDTRLYGNVLCLSVFEDLRDFKNSIVCTYELRRALQRVDPRVTYGTPHAEDMKMFDVFVFFEDSEPREEETAG